MAGNRIDIEIDDKRVRAALSRLIETVGKPFAALDEIGSRLVASTLRRFERETAPDGKPWLKSIRALLSGGQTLQDFGTLKGSITHVVHGDGVEVGSNLVYAAIHQFGGQAGRGRKVTIPARPFLGIDDSDAAAIERIVARHISQAAA